MSVSAKLHHVLAEKKVIWKAAALWHRITTDRKQKRWCPDLIITKFQWSLLSLL